jgi:hypothetical protein
MIILSTMKFVSNLFRILFVIFTAIAILLVEFEFLDKMLVKF